jgi:hypothetical protein
MKVITPRGMMNTIRSWLFLFSTGISLTLVACSTTKVATSSTSTSLDTLNRDKFTLCSSREIDDRYTIKNRTGLLSEIPVWIPRFIYNDGASVYIGIPSGYNGADLKFYVYDNQEQLVATPYQKNKHFYRVDVLFKKALLIKGQAPDQEKVLITYIGNS